MEHAVNKIKLKKHVYWSLMYLTETVSYSANSGTGLVTKKSEIKQVETLKSFVL